VPGSVVLPDGRRIVAERVEVDPRADVTRVATEVELDARALDGPLAVRFPAPGDRFRALGAPGSKRLVRFLADRGVPREERAHVPLVVVVAPASRGADEIVWVAGIAPCEAHRVKSDTTSRLRLALLA
jgi:tRNA(Ile)-lysidine synthase